MMMEKETRPLPEGNRELQSETLARKWARRRDIPIAILAWVALFAVIVWAAGHIIRSLLILAIAALLAFALAPVVKQLQRFMPRVIAILLVYLIAFGGLSALVYVAINTAVHQTFALSRLLESLVNSTSSDSSSPLTQALNTLGITTQQVAAARQEIVSQISTFARDLIPFLRSFFNFVFDTIVVAILSIYLLIDGSRSANWLRRNLPVSLRADFLLDTLQRVVGGYIRGQITLALLITVLVYIGAEFIFHLPFAVFISAIAFVMAFIPVLGTIISGAVCVLIGLSKGWLVAVGVLVYFIIIHVIESEAVGPRIVGKAVGLHPVVSLIALVAGAELFGIWGALFASPLAGVLQAIIVELWREWRSRHPEEFKREKAQIIAGVEEQI
jgi:predicted PurR-regulated permease PerM